MTRLKFAHSEWTDLGNDEQKERICTHLLQFSDKWQIETGKKYAISVLQNVCIPPSRRLELAGKFTIPEWVEPAVKAILNERLANLTDADVRAMGWKVYSMLVNAKEMLETETRRTALVAPPMPKDPSWECQNHTSCLAIWPKLWFDRIGKKLLHASTPMKLNEIRHEIAKDETLKHPALTNHCQVDMVIFITSSPIFTFADEQIIPACAAAVVKYHDSL